MERRTAGMDAEHDEEEAGCDRVADQTKLLDLSDDPCGRRLEAHVVEPLPLVPSTEPKPGTEQDQDPQDAAKA